MCIRDRKSTGEVLGLGRTLTEALFKGLVSAGFHLNGRGGVLISVSDSDKFEIVRLAKKFDELGMKIYATPGTAREIRGLGIDVTEVPKLRESGKVLELLEDGAFSYIIYTGTSDKQCIDEYIRLHRRATQLATACLTSLDTANALADIIASRFNEGNTELVDINHMRREKQKLSFCKMQGTGNDYIFFDNLQGQITCPESLTITYADRHYGIGGDGLVLIEKSAAADAKMRIFNGDGSEGKMAGNCIRCVGKYLYDNGIVTKDTMSIETASGIRTLKLYVMNGKVSSVCVGMGKASLAPESLPVLLDGEKVVGRTVQVAGGEYPITCVSVGNPHCVVFSDKVDAVDIETVGPLFEHDKLFPERVNTEFIRVVNQNTLKMRVWERGNGETFACGTGACAAVVAATENGCFEKGKDITVKVRGGDLIVNYTDEQVYLTGNAVLIYNGTIEY